MAEKDITERILLAINDVFADIVNTLLFQGEIVVQSEQLQDHSERSAYKADEKFHDLERDVIKSYNSSQNIRIACLGIENQSTPDIDMPLRVIGYDGAEYRSQLNGKQRYPIITIVLYFGMKPWNYPKNLLGRIQVPEKFSPYVNDYKMNLYEIGFLTNETVKMFQSDFGVVADYFVQKQQKKHYCPPKKKLNHVKEVLQLLHVFTGDQRFEDIYNNSNFLKERKDVSMCDIVEQIEQKGISKGFEQGIEQGIKQGIEQGIEQGVKQGIKQMALSMFEHNYPLDEIASITKCDKTTILSWIADAQQDSH